MSVEPSPTTCPALLMALAENVIRSILSVAVGKGGGYDLTRIIDIFARADARDSTQVCHSIQDISIQLKQTSEQQG